MANGENSGWSWNLPQEQPQAQPPSRSEQAQYRRADYVNPGRMYNLDMRNPNFDAFDIIMGGISQLVEAKPDTFDPVAIANSTRNRRR